MGDLGHLMSLRCCAIAALIAASACGCQSRSLKALAGKTPVTALRATQSGQLVTIKLGRNLTVALPCDQPLRRWRLFARPNENILKPLGPRRSGAGPRAKLDFIFKAAGIGTTSFALTRPAVDPDKDPEIFELTVFVK